MSRFLLAAFLAVFFAVPAYSATIEVLRTVTVEPTRIQAFMLAQPDMSQWEVTSSEWAYYEAFKEVVMPDEWQRLNLGLPESFIQPLLQCQPAATKGRLMEAPFYKYTEMAVLCPG